MIAARPQPDKAPTKARQKATRPRSRCAALAFVGDVSVICRFPALPRSAPRFPSSNPHPSPLLSVLSVLSVASFLHALRQCAGSGAPSGLPRTPAQEPA